ncbi:hypothetical protein SAMN06295879_3485, partial [Agreia bicolorata]
VDRGLPVEAAGSLGDASGPDRRQAGYLRVKGSDLIERDHVWIAREGWGFECHGTSQTVTTDIDSELAFDT